MVTYELPVGKSINRIAKEMVLLARKSQDKVVTQISNIELVVKPGDKADVIVNLYTKELVRRYRGINLSPEEAQFAKHPVKLDPNQKPFDGEKFRRIATGNMANRFFSQ